MFICIKKPCLYIYHHIHANTILYYNLHTYPISLISGTFIHILANVFLIFLLLHLSLMWYRISLGTRKLTTVKGLWRDCSWVCKYLSVEIALKLHCLHSHLGEFVENLGDVSKEQCEHFHQDVKVMDEPNQCQRDSNMMAEAAEAWWKTFHKFCTINHQNLGSSCSIKIIRIKNLNA